MRRTDKRNEGGAGISKGSKDRLERQGARPSEEDLSHGRVAQSLRLYNECPCPRLVDRAPGGQAGDQASRHGEVESEHVSDRVKMNASVARKGYHAKDCRTLITEELPVDDLCFPEERLSRSHLPNGAAYGQQRQSRREPWLPSRLIDQRPLKLDGTPHTYLLNDLQDRIARKRLDGERAWRLELRLHFLRVSRPGHGNNLEVAADLFTQVPDLGKPSQIEMRVIEDDAGWLLFSDSISQSAGIVINAEEAPFVVGEAICV